MFSIQLCKHKCYGRLTKCDDGQGALLLVLFQASHTVEHMLTARATGDLKNLFDKIPEFATVVELDLSSAPIMSTQQQEVAAKLAVGTNILIKPGEMVITLFHFIQVLRSMLQTTPSWYFCSHSMC